MMKVVPNTALMEKCDSNGINDFDINYMNKLNGSLSANDEPRYNSSAKNAKSNQVEIPSSPGKERSPEDGVSKGCAIINEQQMRKKNASDDLKPEDSDNEYNNSSFVLDPSSDISTEAEEKLAAVRTNLSAGSDSGLESATSSWDKSVNEIKENAYVKLEEELQQAREVLKLRDEEVSRLRQMRQEGDRELLELTASLFEEAHSMVKNANIKRATAEKSLKESLMKVEVLSAEVTALKTLVLTSTPSKPNLHLHNQSHPKMKDDGSFLSNGSPFSRKHHRSPSHFELKYGRDSSPAQKFLDDMTKVANEYCPDARQGYEVDPNFHREFMLWKENPTLDKDNAFITHMYREDIDQCLDFSNSALVAEVKKAIDSDTIFIEAVDKAKAVFPQKCALMEVPKVCYYRMKIADSNEWLYISQMCRNRIIAVCNFLNYLRYIQRGLVKSSADDMFWEMIRLRKEMMLAKLGLPIPSISC